jgi:hypothetical protein
MRTISFATGPTGPPTRASAAFKDETNPGDFTAVGAKFDLPTGVTAAGTRSTTATSSSTKTTT